MYPEFVAIYVGLAIVLVVLIVNLVFTIKVLKKLGGKGNVSVNMNQPAGVIFCKKCAAEFDSRLRVCPNCGTTR